MVIVEYKIIKLAQQFFYFLIKWTFKKLLILKKKFCN